MISSTTSGFNNVVTHTDGAGTVNAAHCRAWVNFDGTAGTISPRASFNVSSITDNGSGDYTVNFSNAMSDANYSASGTSALNNTGNTWRIPTQMRPWTTTYSDWECIVTTTGAVADHEFVTLDFHR